MDGVGLLVLIFLSPVFMALLHGAASRLLKLSGRRVLPQTVCIGSVLAGNVPFLTAVFYLTMDGPGRLSAFLYSLIVYNALGYSYFHLFNMSDTARRIRILIDVYTRGGIREDEAAALYDTSRMIDLRIERLLAAGQIRETGGRYVLSGSILYTAARVLHLWSALSGMALYREQKEDRR